MMETAQDDAVVAALRADEPAGHRDAGRLLGDRRRPGPRAAAARRPGRLGRRRAHRRRGRRTRGHPQAQGRGEGDLRGASATRPRPTVKVTTAESPTQTDVAGRRHHARQGLPATRPRSPSTSASRSADPAPGWSSRSRSTTRSPPDRCSTGKHIAGTGTITPTATSAPSAASRRRSPERRRPGRRRSWSRQPTAAISPGCKTDLTLIKVGTLARCDRRASGP